MLIHEEQIQILYELGLTRTQAKVYIALLCLKIGTAKKIHGESKVARQDVYRAISELEEKNLIERIISKPTRFRPLPPNEAVSILLQIKNEKNSQLRKKADKMFRNFEIDWTKMWNPNGLAQFVFLSKNKTNPVANTHNMGEFIDEAQKSVMCLTTFQLFMKFKFADEEIWKKAVKRGVEFKFIIDRTQESAKLEPNLDPELENHDCFEIRWINNCSPASVALVDEREAFCRMGLEVESPVLWSTNHCFVGMIKDYLETKWKLLEQARATIITE